MSATINLETLELATMEVTAWGEPAYLIDGWEDGTLRADLFGLTAPQAIITAARSLVAAGEPPTNEALHRQMMATGWECWTAATALAVDGGREALVAVLPDAGGHRYAALPHLLHLLHEEHERQRLHAQLVGLAGRLYAPGGVAKVAEAMAVVA